MANAGTNLECLLHEMAGERECEEAVGDCGAERGFAGRALAVEMNPLAIFGSFGELRDALLCYWEPIGGAELLAD